MGVGEYPAVDAVGTIGLATSEERILSKSYHVILETCYETCSGRMKHGARMMKIAQCIVLKAWLVLEAIKVDNPVG